AQTGTLSGNPIAATAGLATLRELKKPGTYERFFTIGKKLWDNLEALLKEFNIKGQIVGEPPLFDIVFTDREISDARSMSNEDKTLPGKLHAEVLKRGILKGGRKTYLSTAHTEEDIEKTTEAFAEALKAILN
ncbi:MAG: aspartate aminotransferase family protein, partial [Candidatus Tectomicrobia bacterium]|nr:aspartate aminotransferase family protein [Candidatus Tectomicrobia bacterium]